MTQYRSDFRYHYLPYCLHRQPDGRYAVLNRDYKPVGFFTAEWIEYGEFPILGKIKGLTPAKAEKLSAKGSDDLDRIYLYNDGCVPTQGAKHMRDYLDRLALLSKLRIES